MVPSQSSSAGERSEATGSRTTASRRTVLRFAGATAGTGLLVGQAAGETGPDAEATTIGVSPGQRSAVDGTIDRLEDPPSDALSIETVGTTAGFRAYADGDVDLLVSSRPILAGERSRVLQNDRAYEAREVPTSLATLEPPAPSWSDCLRPAKLAATWSNDDPVETWAEVSSADAATNFDHAGRSGNHDGARLQSESGSTLVRGVRSHQYAAGSGGVGYYKPDEDWIDQGARTADAGSTTLVKLSYLYGDRTVLDRASVGAFLEAYGQRSADRVGDVAYFADPLGQ